MLEKMGTMWKEIEYFEEKIREMWQELRGLELRQLTELYGMQMFI